MMLHKALLLAILLTSGTSIAANLPPFFSNIEEEVFFPGGVADWALTRNFTGDNRRILKWTSGDGQEITLTYANSAPNTAEGVYQGLAELVDQSIQRSGGNIIAHGEFFAIVVVNDSTSTPSVNLLYGTPRGSYLWQYRIPGASAADLEPYIRAITPVARKHQYDVAAEMGNVVMGRWGGPVHEYAKLLANQNNPAAHGIYQKLLLTSPTNYDAQIEYATLTDDAAQKRQSATIVARDAEEEALLDNAAEILRHTTPSVEQYPLLTTNDSGLKVVLIPLEPLNPWLLEEIASNYQEITSIPVVIRRLPVALNIPEPTRSSYRPYLEQIASNIWKGTVNSSQWPLAELKAQLMQKAKVEGPQSVAVLNRIFQEMDDGDYQWDAVPMLLKFSKVIVPYFSGDPNTMVVGITEMDIYTDESNFVFSVAGGYEESPVSIMSYARMRAKLTGEKQSRKRLTERAAKELVPASLKILQIPRSSDPFCPYSYSDGLQRLDEKTMKLSEPVKMEIEKRMERDV